MLTQEGAGCSPATYDHQVSEYDEQGAGDGWATVPGVAEPAERVEFDTLEFVNELTHPLRAQIMRQLKVPKTAAEIADSLTVPVTRLYHHLKRLEDAGLIQVVATRKVAAVIERRYQVVARSMGVALKFFDSHNAAEVATALGSVFDMAKMTMQQEVEAGTIRIDQDDDNAILSFSRVSLTPERRHELMGRLNALLAEYTTDIPTAEDAATDKVSLLVAAHLESS